MSDVQQVSFYENDVEDAELIGGILVDNRYLICGDCGCTWDLEEEPDAITIVERFDEWVPISIEILGN